MTEPTPRRLGDRARRQLPDPAGARHQRRNQGNSPVGDLGYAGRGIDVFQQEGRLASPTLRGTHTQRPAPQRAATPTAALPNSAVAKSQLLNPTLKSQCSQPTAARWTNSCLISLVITRGARGLYLEAYNEAVDWYFRRDLRAWGELQSLRGASLRRPLARSQPLTHADEFRRDRHQDDGRAHRHQQQPTKDE